MSILQENITGNFMIAKFIIMWYYNHRKGELERR